MRREISTEKRTTEQNKTSESQGETADLSLSPIDFENCVFDRKHLNVDDESNALELELTLSKRLELERVESSSVSKGLLWPWHVRLGHESLAYLKLLQKCEPVMKGVRFDSSIQECEISVFAKMETLAFGSDRVKADRPCREFMGITYCQLHRRLTVDSVVVYSYHLRKPGWSTHSHI